MASPLPCRSLDILVTVATLPLVGAETRSDGLTDAEVIAFLDALQDAVRSDKPTVVAALVVFPLRVNKPTRKTRIAAVAGSAVLVLFSDS